MKTCLPNELNAIDFFEKQIKCQLPNKIKVLAVKDKHTTHIMDENEMTPTALQSACFIQEHRRRCLLHGVLEYLFPSHTEFKLQRR